MKAFFFVCVCLFFYENSNLWNSKATFHKSHKSLGLSFLSMKVITCEIIELLFLTSSNGIYCFIYHHIGLMTQNITKSFSKLYKNNIFPIVNHAMHCQNSWLFKIIFCKLRFQNYIMLCHQLNFRNKTYSTGNKVYKILNSTLLFFYTETKRFSCISIFIIVIASRVCIITYRLKALKQSHNFTNSSTDKKLVCGVLICKFKLVLRN